MARAPKKPGKAQEAAKAASKPARPARRFKIIRPRKLTFITKA